jgi:CarD family transcriptional regulator, regulator of rRNA transcription
MVRKATINKSAAKKADARKHAAPKAAARSSPSSAKAVPRKAQPANVHTKAAVKPAAKTDHASKVPVKKPVAQAKPVAAKTQAKPVAAAKPITAQPSAGMKKPAVPAKAVLSHAPVGTQRIPTTAPRQFGQAVAALAAPKAVAQKAMLSRQQPAPSKQAAAAVAPKKPVNQRHGFKTNEWIVYPAHGVGRIVGIEEQEIAGMSLELFVITFDKDKMTLRVPTGKSASVGMRKLAEEGVVRRAMETLKGRARIKRTMWSRRAQEYEAKINSGDLVAIAEVVRDLYRSESQPEQSYSERQLYEAALDRMAREIAAVEKLDERGAVQRITEVLAKSAKGRRVAAEEAEVKAA